MKKFHRIVLYARQHRAASGVYETLQRLTTCWKQSPHRKLFLESETAHHFTDLNLPVADFNVSEAYDLIVVVGGDGSLLGAARLAVKKGIPIVGINRGHLGFLTSILPDEAEEKLEAVLNGAYEEEYRFLLCAHIQDEMGRVVEEGLALNDVVLTQGDDPAMIDFDVFDHKALISHYRADGLIVATPTGSTAYALSAGGPIIHPTMDAITLVPMFPHTLSSRPIVLGTQNPIQIHLRSLNALSSRLILDGQAPKMVKSGQWIYIEKCPQKLCLLQPVGYSYYETLRSKLGWETKNF